MTLSYSHPARRRPSDAAPRPGKAASIPVFLLTGFLGSGKTTLLRRLLAGAERADTALIINEFGAVGLDQMLVQTAIENVLLMDDGCLCCSVRGDLVDTIGDLFSRVENGELPRFARIVIETTGLADPRPIVQDIASARGLAGRVHLERVITTVDAVLGAQQLGELDEVVAQVAQADICVVTKVDLVEPEACQRLIQQLRDLNPAAAVLAGDSDEAAPAPLFAAGPLPPQRQSAGLFAYDAGAPRIHPRVRSWSVRHEGALDWGRLLAWLDLLYSSRPADMLRMKAIVHVEGRDEPVVLHGVGAMVDPPSTLPAWPWSRPTSEIVVIATDLPPEQIGRLFDAVVLGKTSKVGTTSMRGES